MSLPKADNTFRIVRWSANIIIFCLTLAYMLYGDKNNRYPNFTWFSLAYCLIDSLFQYLGVNWNAVGLLTDCAARVIMVSIYWIFHHNHLDLSIGLIIMTMIPINAVILCHWWYQDTQRDNQSETPTENTPLV